MKVKITTENEKPFLTLVYEGEELEKLNSKFRQLGVEESTTNNGWGEGYSLKYFRATNRVFFNSLNMATGYNEEYLDDINSSVFNNKVFNIAVFRVIPNGNKTKVPLDTLLSVNDINILATRIAKSVETIYNTITGEVEIKVNTGL